MVGDVGRAAYCSESSSSSSPGSSPHKWPRSEVHCTFSAGDQTTDSSFVEIQNFPGSESHLFPVNLNLKNYIIFHL